MFSAAWFRAVGAWFGITSAVSEADLVRGMRITDLSECTVEITDLSDDLS